MRYTVIFAKSAALFMLLVFTMAAAQAHAQNQTPVNVAPAGWIDPATGLTWTKGDNGSAVDWNQAKAYCSNLRLGGYSDWRLPTIDELQSIYDPNIDIPVQWSDRQGEEHVTILHMKGNLKLTDTSYWSSSLENPREAWSIYFKSGSRDAIQLFKDVARALCVRH